MLSLSPMKVFVIVAVVVMLLGPDKLPEVAHKLGVWWQGLRRFQQRVESEVREVIPDLPSSGDIARLARSPVTMLNELADRAENISRGASDVNPGVPTSSAPAPSPTTRADSPTGPLSADPSLN